MSEVGAKTTWGLGEYPRMAQLLDDVSEQVIERAAPDSEDRVLDVACGTGNAAILAAARGAQVTGVDIEPVLLAIARDRADTHGFDVSFQEADAAALPFADEAFSVVVSVFGVMYAADQFRSASELGRVCQDGGRVVLASWTPSSFMPAMGGVLADYLPPPPAGSTSPTRWGNEQVLGQLLGPGDIDLQHASREHLTLRFRDQQEAAMFLLDTAGHVVAERKRLEHEERWNTLVAALYTFIDERNTSRDNHVALDLEYLLATGNAG